MDNAEELSSTHNSTATCRASLLSGLNPSQEKFSAGPEPPQSPHSSSTALPPHVPAQSATLPSQSHAPSAIPSPLHTPHSSSTALPPHVPAQSIVTVQFPSQSKFASG